MDDFVQSRIHVTCELERKLSFVTALSESRPPDVVLTITVTVFAVRRP
jgi:hypothetical protein